MRYRTDRNGKIVPYKKRKRELQMVFDDSIYEPSFDECVDEVCGDEYSDDTLGETHDPVLRHHINMLQSLLQHRLHYDISNIDWDSMTMRDVKELTHTCNMMLLESPIQKLRTRLEFEKNMRDR